jgi:chromosome segregation ATPase
MKRLIICLALLGIYPLSGCSEATKPRVEVAKDKILAQVDALLGEVDVKHKAVENAMKTLGDGIDKLKKGKIEAKVRVAKVGEQVIDLDQKIAEADKALGRLRDYLKEEKDVEISGKTFTPAQLKEMADKTISARKSLSTQVEALRQSKDRLENVASTLEAREKESSQKIGVLKQQLDEIDAKVLALKSIKEASTISGNDTSVDFASVEKDVRSLSTKVDVELAYHDEKWKDAASANDKDVLESVVRDTSTSDDTLSEIEKILGK